MTLTLSTKALVIAGAWGFVLLWHAVYGLYVALKVGTQGDNEVPGCLLLGLVIIATTVTACAVLMM